MTTILTFIILALAVYRLTHFIVFDKLFENIRKNFVTRGFDGQNITFTLQGGNVRRFIGSILNCYWCTGIWVSGLFIVGVYTVPQVTTAISWLYALAAVAALIETKLLKSVGAPLEMKEVKATLEEDPLTTARGIINGLIITFGFLLLVFGLVLLLS
ncbi:MAG: hypothetical protein K0Q73_7931 [Paenibacillus sp.]|jgi:hypothetical protein|nr:hypothetical protein [Paenibacillus sp.]